MGALKQKLEAFRGSRVGQFFKKFQDDKATELASLLAWGTLSTLLPLLLGVMGLAGLVLRDPERLNQLYDTLLAVVPQDALEPLSDALASMRENAAGTVGIGLVLLLYNGSRFFTNMTSIFNQAYHVENRNMVKQTVVSVLMLLITTVLLVFSTTALGIGGLLGSLPIALPVGPVVGRVISWSLSIVSALAVFLLLYKILPNAKQGWRDVLPGTLGATALFFAIMLLFPLYTTFFPPNQTYATFGLFLVFTFWLYLLGIVFVMGAEINAYVQQPARSVALAEATADAAHGKADIRQQGGEVHAEAVGTAATQGESNPTAVNPDKPGATSSGSAPAPGSAQARGSAQPAPAPSSGKSFGGALLGFVGMIAAAVLLRGKLSSRPPQPRSAA